MAKHRFCFRYGRHCDAMPRLDRLQFCEGRRTVLQQLPQPIQIPSRLIQDSLGGIETSHCLPGIQHDQCLPQPNPLTGHHSNGLDAASQLGLHGGMQPRPNRSHYLLGGSEAVAFHNSNADSNRWQRRLRLQRRNRLGIRAATRNPDEQSHNSGQPPCSGSRRQHCLHKKEFHSTDGLADEVLESRCGHDSRSSGDLDSPVKNDKGRNGLNAIAGRHFRYILGVDLHDQGLALHQ